MSPNIEKFTGTKPEDFIGKTNLEAGFSSDMAKFFDKHLLEAIHSKKSVDVSFSYPGPNGLIWAEGRVYPEFDYNGDVKSVVTVNRDITEHKKAVDKIKSSEFKYRKLYESMMDAFAHVDNEGHIIEFNEVFRQMLGYDPDELLKLTYRDITPEKWHESEAEILKNQVYDRGFTDIYEKEYLRKDGSIFPVELRTYQLRDEQGHPNGLWAIVRDISKRKESEKLLLESESKFRELFDNANDMIALNEIEENIMPGKFIEVNKIGIERLGYSREEFLNMTPTDIVAPDNHAKMRIIAKEFQNNSRAQFEIVHLTKDGKRIHVEVNNHLFNLGGRHVALAISRDITERKISEEKINYSLKEKNVLLKEIHHRVKNNMQIISSLLSLQTNYIDDNIALDVLKESQNRVKTMAMIHEKLYQSNDFVNIKFDDYILRLVSDLFYSYNIQEDQIKPVIQVEDVKLNIETAVPCGLIISELVSNSLKYAFPEGKNGKMNISLKRLLNKYELTVSDNGIGFPEDLDFRNTNSLGLQLVNNLVEQIDGEITLEYGQGTKFTIIFKEMKYKERI